MELTGRLALLLAAAEIDEIRGGHQSRVFRVVAGNGDVLVAKVLDEALVDRHDLDARLVVTAALADLDPRVCRPLVVGAEMVTEVTLDDGTHRYVVCYEFAEGAALDASVSADAERMGKTLAQLHTSMRRLPPTGLPLVAALRTAAPAATAIAGKNQLLHGDFNAGNLRDVNGLVRVFDLDDCGYGPPAFDVANALYMVQFDSFVHSTPQTCRMFRETFVSGYVDVSGRALAEDVLDSLIDLRVEALRSWLDDLANAPIGIRSSSTDWLATLRHFVGTHRPKRH